MNEQVENQEKQDEPIVMVDECGDTLWDAVLEQEEAIKALFQ